MTIDDVKKLVAEIDAAKADYETAHSMEDHLYLKVLGAIALGKAESAAELAAEALKAADLDFPRYTA